MKDIKLTRDDVKYKNNHKFKKKIQFDNYIKKDCPSFSPGRLEL